MIYVNMGSGRLGNQFFRYAFARQLQKHNPNETVIYNFDEVHRTLFNSGFRNENSLLYFKTVGIERQDAINYSIPQYIVWKLFNRFYPRGASFSKINRYERKWIGLMSFFGLYYLKLGYHSFSLKKPWWVKNLIVNCCAESEKYFDGIGDQLRCEFQPKLPLSEYNKPLMDVIKQSDSVAISIRRGDFVDDAKTKGTYFVCDKSYYERAINLIRQKVKNPTFIFFSNDIKWVKDNIKIDGCPCYYESGKDEQWEVMRLMSSCKHFIISNSTFHWWAQYLSTNQDKIVIAPNRWYNDKFKSELYQKNWTKIEV